VATSVFIDHPEKAPEGDPQIVAAMVNLADRMAIFASSATAGHLVLRRRISFHIDVHGTR
jgi:hypothetical protein